MSYIDFVCPGCKKTVRWHGKIELDSTGHIDSGGKFRVILRTDRLPSCPECGSRLDTSSVKHIHSGPPGRMNHNVGKGA